MHRDIIEVFEEHEQYSDKKDGSGKSFTVYDLTDDEWVEREFMSVATVEEKEAYESMEITLYDNPYWGRACSFYLSNDNTEMECYYSDEKFMKSKEE